MQGGIRAALLELGDAIGRAGLIAAAALIAYFIGSLSEEARRWLLARWQFVRWRQQIRARRGRFGAVGTRRGERSIMQYLQRALATLDAHARAKGHKDLSSALDWPAGSQMHVGDWEWLIPDVAAELFRDRVLLRLRLLVTEPSLAAEADRFEAEGHLRLSVVAPATAIFITLATQHHIAWLVGLIFIVLLAWQGQQRLRDAADVVADALLADIIAAPSVDRLVARIKPAPAYREGDS